MPGPRDLTSGHVTVEDHCYDRCTGEPRLANGRKSTDPVECRAGCYGRCVTVVRSVVVVVLVTVTGAGASVRVTVVGGSGGSVTVTVVVVVVVVVTVVGGGGGGVVGAGGGGVTSTEPGGAGAADAGDDDGTVYRFGPVESHPASRTSRPQAAASAGVFALTPGSTRTRAPRRVA